MRKLISYILFVCFITICSCTNQDDNPKTTIEDTKVEVLTPDPTHGFRSVSLAENELNINLYIPEKFYEDEDGFPRFIQPNIKHNLGEARWEITLPGLRRWHLVIEEMGKDSSGVTEEIERLKKEIDESSSEIRSLESELAKTEDNLEESELILNEHQSQLTKQQDNISALREILASKSSRRSSFAPLCCTMTSPRSAARAMSRPAATPATLARARTRPTVLALAAHR